MIPSSRFLAAAVAEIAKRFAPASSIPLIEVGPGTGALTRVLVELGHPLLLLERNREFARALAAQFPQAVVLGEDFLTTTAFVTGNRGALLISSLPIRTLPHPELFRARFQELLLRGAVSAVIQYSYGWRDPLELDRSRVETRRERLVFRNFPPAFIWSYRVKRSE